MKFQWPIDPPYRWISGYKFNPPSHNGLDYGTKNGANYYAPQDGIIKVARFTLPPNTTGQKYGYGNYIQIDHGGGWISLGAHLQEGYVSVGDKVTIGQLIGLTDNTGWSSGPHLHFELKLNGSPMNPANYLFDIVDPDEPDPEEPPIEVPDPEFPQLPIAVVNVDPGRTLYIRSYPKATTTSKVVGTLNRGDEIAVIKTVMDGMNKWLKVGHNQFVCMTYHEDSKVFDLCKWKG